MALREAAILRSLERAFAGGTLEPIDDPTARGKLHVLDSGHSASAPCHGHLHLVPA